MDTENLSNTYLTNGGDLTQHMEKEEVYLLLANSMPQNIQLKDALYGGLLFVADVIHQIDPENESMILELSKNMLDCEYHNIQKKFKEE